MKKYVCRWKEKSFSDLKFTLYKTLAEDSCARKADPAASIITLLQCVTSLFQNVRSAQVNESDLG
jgi:hypothetical protein